jgi:hypothetical protein
MTLDQFLALKPRDRDMLVAEKVMGGWPSHRFTETCGCDVCRSCGACPNIPETKPHCERRYTTSIADAWEVVEKFEYYSAYDTGVGHQWNFPRHDGGALADTAPLAICIAALRAVGALTD